MFLTTVWNLVISLAVTCYLRRPSRHSHGAPGDNSGPLSIPRSINDPGFQNSEFCQDMRKEVQPGTGSARLSVRCPYALWTVLSVGPTLPATLPEP